MGEKPGKNHRECSSVWPVWFPIAEIAAVKLAQRALKQQACSDSTDQMPELQI